MKGREKVDWDSRWRLVYIKKSFSIRIQQDLQNIPEPKELPETIESTYIFGASDSGKTIYSAFMMLKEQEIKFMVGADETKLDGCYFISVPELFQKIKNSFNPEPEQTEQQIIDFYSSVHLLVLDDLGIVKSTDWAYQTLYLIINRRYENLKKTIITSNLSLSELANSLEDDRISSRIRRMGKVFEKTHYSKIK
jgi:DNA replication protein DnaC